MPIKIGAWEKDEDELLAHWQGKVGNKWSEVAKHIPGRTGQQCAQRWRHKVNPNIRRDKWSAQEDARLEDLVKTFGIGKWAEIARHMEGRTDQQCMGRWRRHLDPTVRRDSWRPEEDARLMALYQQYGTGWSRISRLLKGRTSQQCRARWHQIDSGRSRRGSRQSGSGGGVASGGGGRRRRGAAPTFDSDESNSDGDEAMSGSEGGGAEAEGAAPPAGRQGARRQQQWGRRQLGDEGVEKQEWGPEGPQQHGVGASEEGAGSHMVGGAAAAGPSSTIWVANGEGAEAAIIDGVRYGVRRRAAVRPSGQQQQQRQQQQQQNAGPSSPPVAPAQLPPLRPPVSAPSRRAEAAARGAAAAVRGSTGGSGAGASPNSPGVGALSPSFKSPPAAARRLSVGGCYTGDEPGTALRRSQAGAQARAAAGEALGWQQVAQAREFDDEEAAGAQTLLHMAALLRGGSNSAEAAAAAGAEAAKIAAAAGQPAARVSDDLAPRQSMQGRPTGGAVAGADAAEQDFQGRLAAAAAADCELAPLAAGGGLDGAGQPHGGGSAGLGERAVKRAGTASSDDVLVGDTAEGFGGCSGAASPAVRRGAVAVGAGGPVGTPVLSVASRAATAAGLQSWNESAAGGGVLAGSPHPDNPHAGARSSTPTSAHAQAHVGSHQPSPAGNALGGCGALAPAGARRSGPGVARRLDKHEAWAAANACTERGAVAPAVPAGLEAGGGLSPRELPSPQKRQRVPLDAATSSGSGGGNCVPPWQRGQHEPSRLNPKANGAAKSWASAAAPSRRPAARLVSWRLPPASALLATPPRAAGTEKWRMPVPQVAVEAAAGGAAFTPSSQQQQQHQQQQQVTWQQEAIGLQLSQEQAILLLLQQQQQQQAQAQVQSMQGAGRDTASATVWASASLPPVPPLTAPSIGQALLANSGAGGGSHESVEQARSRLHALLAGLT